MFKDDKKDISRRLFEKVWNEGKTEMIPELHTPDFFIKDPYNPVSIKGVEAVRQYLMNYKKAFPDLFIRVDRQIAEDDFVVNFLTATGTHQGTLLDVPPTNKTVTLTAIVTLRFVDDKIAECDTMWDALGFLRTVGSVQRVMEPLAARR